ncbi:LuxR C-terminal-related transcriptional regulator [uncultured Microbacterium sp.]|uniref:LuxR C-terminal-related transcriptional regulator n=1 Tax=uncultured Microbacterium sp. TaxID=191216 RepID=UPI00345B20E3
MRAGPNRLHTNTPRVAGGASNAHIAARMYLSDSTVRSSISRMIRRLNVENRVQLAKLIWDKVHRRP